MNIILLEPSEILEHRAVIEDERAKHIAKVLRSSPGDSIRVGVVNGLTGSGIIGKINRRPPYSVELQISLTDHPPLPSNVDIVLALPRPIMFKRILSQATTLGVKNFHIINASRVEKSFWDAHVIDEHRYRKHLLKGLVQAVDTRLPNVYFQKGFKTFIDAEISKLKHDYRYLVVADPRFSKMSPDTLAGGAGRILLAIGPEGGWVDYEIDRMVQSGFVGFGNGSRILRVDTAVIAMHSMLTTPDRSEIKL
jgi:16S rRNA (uracil1498-N3)-methyltransferase